MWRRIFYEVNVSHGFCSFILCLAWNLFNINRQKPFSVDHLHIFFSEHSKAELALCYNISVHLWETFSKVIPSRHRVLQSLKSFSQVTTTWTPGSQHSTMDCVWIMRPDWVQRLGRALFSFRFHLTTLFNSYLWLWSNWASKINV